MVSIAPIAWPGQVSKDRSVIWSGTSNVRYLNVIPFSDVEAVYREGEKAAAAKNRRRKRIMNGATTADSGDEGNTVKKIRTGTTNGANGSDGSATDSSTKAKARKEGAKPLGRPKKRNPDGTLVHPPKPPRPQKLDAAGTFLGYLI